MATNNTDEKDRRAARTESEPLSRLTTEGQRLVDSQFLRGERTITEDELAECVEPYPSEEVVNLAGLRADFEELREEYEQYEAGMDAAAAPIIHRRLDISRRVASDPGVWHYLTVVEFPEFVRHRWEYSTESAMREKFLGAGKDIFSNALHRLWWIAELTHDDGDYTLTRRAFENQTLANKLFDRWYARYRPATVVCCELLCDEPAAIGEEVTLELNRVLSTLQLEGMDESELRDVVGRLLKDAKASRE